MQELLMRILEVTEDEFDRLVPSDWPRGDAALNEEVGWWVSERYLGIIIRDLIDKDYGFVVLARNPVAFADVATSFETVEDACHAMVETMRRGAG